MSGKTPVSPCSEMALYRAISTHSSTAVSLEDTVSGKTQVSPCSEMALYRASSAHSSTVVNLGDTVSGKAPVSPVKWLCIGLSVHTVVQ